MYKKIVTAGIAVNALRLSGYNLVKQWNKVLIKEATKSLTKALVYALANRKYTIYLNSGDFFLKSTIYCFMSG